MLAEDKWSQETVFLCQRNRPKRDNCSLVGILRIRTTVVNHNTVHECRLKEQNKYCASNSTAVIAPQRLSVKYKSFSLFKVYN